MNGAALLIFSLGQSASFGILYGPPLYFLHTPHWYITAFDCSSSLWNPIDLSHNACEVPAWNNRSWNSLINNFVQCSFFGKYIGVFVSPGIFIAFVNLPRNLMIASSSNCKPTELIMLPFDKILFMIQFFVSNCTCRIHCFLAFLSSLPLIQSFPLCYG